jgi:hypothetical protein
MCEAENNQPFLDLEQVPDDLWQKLYPGQRALHTLWTRKFAPLYDDHERIPRTDVSDDDRALIQALLEALASRRLRFAQPVESRGDAVAVLAFETEALILEKRTCCRLRLRIPADEGDTRGEISFSAEHEGGEVDVVLEWRPQADPERGTILLYPQAANRKHRFGVAAYNRRQFVNICKALVDYCAPGQEPWLHRQASAIPSHGPEFSMRRVS